MSRPDRTNIGSDSLGIELEVLVVLGRIFVELLCVMIYKFLSHTHYIPRFYIELERFTLNQASIILSTYFWLSMLHSTENLPKKVSKAKFGYLSIIG